MGLFFPQIANAHGYIIRSIPENGAVLAQAPSRIQIWFTENLEPSFSTLSVSDQHGQAVPLTDVGLAPTNAAQLTAKLPTSLPSGAYVVTIRAAFASDGHVSTETLVFWVGAQSGDFAANGPSREALPLETLWRFISIVALNILFGTAFLYQVVLLPGWGNPAYRAGKLPPRLMVRLNILMWVTIALATVGTIIALLQQATVLFSTDVVTVIQNKMWSIVLSGTQFGQVLTLRFALIGIAAVIQAGTIYLASRQPEFVSLLWALNTVVTGAILGTLSASSHAAGSTLWPLAAIGVDWLHLLANAAWIGGLIGLAVVLPVALTPLKDAERRTALQVVLRRFSAVGTSALALLLVTGIFNALLHVRQPSDIPDTSYGLTLVAKIVLIVPLLCIALYHHLSAAPGRLVGLASRLPLVERFDRMVSSLRLESALGVSVVLAAALLTATPPPVPPEAQTNLQPPMQVVSVSDLRVTLILDPGAVGANTYEVGLEQNSQPVRGAQVKLQFAYPSLDKRSGWLTMDDAGDGSYLGVGPDLERSGQWLALVDVSAANLASPARAAFKWAVPDEVPTATTRQASALNWLSAASILIVAVAIVTPGFVRTVKALKLQPEGVIIGTAALIGTIVLLTLGAWVLADATRRSDELGNPVPAVINPVFPDMASLTTGQAIYQARCVTCHGENGVGNPSQPASSAPPDLTRRLPGRRDEELYRAISQHKGLEGQLSEADVWNLVNYLRSVRFARSEPIR